MAAPLWRGKELPPGFRRAFWERVGRDDADPGDCWPWQGTISRGYGLCKLFNTNERAHRIAFFLHHGWVPRLVRHECDDRTCCNPAHLLAGTHQDNADDMTSRGRQARGEKQGSHKLTDDAVRSIRASGLSYAQLAAIYEVSKENIGQIKRGESWKHLL